MSFNNMTKKVMLTKIDTVKMSPQKLCTIFAQYNPDKFEHWKQCSYGSSKRTILQIENSPHVQLLSKLNIFTESRIRSIIHETNYYKLQSLYGRNSNWIEQKIDKFFRLFNDILANGIKEHPVILDKPLISSKYNSSGCEIWEGHHRIACCIVAEKTCMVEICKWRLSE